MPRQLNHFCFSMVKRNTAQNSQRGNDHFWCGVPASNPRLHAIGLRELCTSRRQDSSIDKCLLQAVIRYMEEKLQQKAVPAILENEAIGLSTGKRGRTSSVSEAPVTEQKALDSLMQELTGFHRTLSLHGVDQELIVQVFKQVSVVVSHLRTAYIIIAFICNLLMNHY